MDCHASILFSSLDLQQGDNKFNEHVFCCEPQPPAISYRLEYKTPDTKVRGYANSASQNIVSRVETSYNCSYLLILFSWTYRAGYQMPFVVIAAMMCYFELHIMRFYQIIAAISCNIWANNTEVSRSCTVSLICAFILIYSLFVVYST